MSRHIMSCVCRCQYFRIVSYHLFTFASSHRHLRMPKIKFVNRNIVIGMMMFWYRFVFVMGLSRLDICF